MYLSEFKEQTQINPEGFKFEITCSKCNSKNVSLERYDDIGMGSEYTGPYGDAGLIFKCRECGNAYSYEITGF